MARSRLCRSCSEFHDLAEPWPDDCLGHFKAAGESSALYVISDSIAPFRSQADGKMYDSKSSYRADLKARGLVEVGNENVTQKAAQRPPVRDTLRQTFRQLGG